MLERTGNRALPQKRVFSNGHEELQMVIKVNIVEINVFENDYFPFLVLACVWGKKPKISKKLLELQLVLLFFPQKR